MNFEQLRDECKGEDFIPYTRLLETDEWKQKRQQIITRDGHKCTNCGKGDTFDEYNTKTGKRIHFWFGKDKWVMTRSGDEVPLPQPIFAGKQYRLQVHHHLYVVNRLPWEYDDGELTTLCNWCHWDFHQNNVVPIYSEDLLNELKYAPCLRCNGAGWFPEFKHVQAGICFRCGGAKYEELIGRGY